ncbi:AraC family transcriptional regulator [Intrasporangium calvum]|uniref:AraC family transcriptional regulator n=1 Tax=Intrasporangium calvum TaxID=53358 RepID=A0ABT5GGG1_9MICO|nr:AraC family transcriptional regulator [Intrasporangium calvum]MDC5697179.1 AraC family transcriptional regulator [Intrasporangium calvum]
MDLLAAALDGHRARGAHVLHVEMEAPWSIAVADEATLGLVLVVRGEGWLERDGHPPVMLRPGDAAITTAGLAYTFAHAPGVPPTIVIGPEETSRDLVGRELCVELSTGLRRWGTAEHGEDAFVTATYGLPGQVTGRLLESLPDVVVVRAQDRSAGGHTLVEALVDELERDLPGQDVVIDRLVDLILIGTLRAWFARPDAAPPRWWLAEADPVAGPALRAMHADPGRAWTLDSLARQANVSRATLARRFTEVAGEPPIAYLTRWRLMLAAELLVETDATVEQIAHRVGYQSAFAFSAAFRRVHDASPRTFRRGRAPSRVVDDGRGPGGIPSVL